MHAQVQAGSADVPRADHLASLLQRCDSQLERAWLHLLNERGYRLPSHAQPLLASCGTRPDFLYEEQMVAIYIDGPVHAYPERQARDAAQTECLEDEGYLVLRFGVQDDWAALLTRYPHIFGGGL